MCILIKKCLKKFKKIRLITHWTSLGRDHKATSLMVNTKPAGSFHANLRVTQHRLSIHLRIKSCDFNRYFANKLVSNSFGCCQYISTGSLDANSDR